MAARKKELVERYDRDAVREAINLMREDCGDAPLTRTTLVAKLKQYGLPSYGPFINQLVNFHVLEKEHAVYTFINPKKPVNKAKIWNCFEAYLTGLDAYQKDYRTRCRQTRARESAAVDKAVRLLKELGYDIYAPLGKLYVKL